MSIFHSMGQGLKKTSNLLVTLRSFILLLLMALLLAPSLSFATNFGVKSTSDVDLVTVMTVTGTENYFSNFTNGTSNYNPRALVAQKFYETHKDEYDFLVIFTNFVFFMPQAGAKGFYSGIRNDVQGIGVGPGRTEELFDYRPSYGINGKKLQGLIEMANIAGHTSDPLDPKFEETLMELSHEMMHRWGAYIRYKTDPADLNSPDSEGLLGKDNAHWSYLFETNGSTLYGNHWQDNGDGTFTSISPDNHVVSGIGRIFSPLELYLMGMIDKTQVPDMLLIDNPLIDKNQLPKVGDTISGLVSTVSMTQIVAAMGERVPSAAETSKTIKMAFIYLTTDDIPSNADLAGIEAIRKEWVTRFSVLTDGKAMMEVAPSPITSLTEHPLITSPTLTLRTTPVSINDGLNWLISQQQSDGRWEDLSSTTLRDTAETLLTLKYFTSAQQNYFSGLTWLNTASIENTDYLARAIEALSSDPGQDVSVLKNELIGRQNSDGGWGSKSGFGSNNLDTALALKALASAGYADPTVLTNAIAYLSANQNSDNGWSAGNGKDTMTSTILPTASVLSAFNVYRSGFGLDEEKISTGKTWLQRKQNLEDGGFGNSPSTVYDTAVAVLALRELRADTSITNNGLTFLRDTQDIESPYRNWNHSTFQTALAVRALRLTDTDPDLSIIASNIVFNPEFVTTLSESVTITARINNTGQNSVSNALVRLYEVDPISGTRVKVGNDVTTSFPGQTATMVLFVVEITDGLSHTYEVSVDPNNVVIETSKLNNIASNTIVSTIPKPVVGFNLAGSANDESAPSVRLQVSLNSEYHLPVSVSYTVNLLASTATNTLDFKLAPGSLVFSPGDTVKYVDLLIVDDPLHEEDESILVDLLNPSNATLGQSTHNYSIMDNDVAPLVTIISPTVGTIATHTPQLVYEVVPSDALVTVIIDNNPLFKASGDYLDLAEGTHTVTVQASNGVNVGSAAVSFVIDTRVPVVTIHSPVEGVYSTGSIPLSYEVTNGTPIVTVNGNPFTGSLLDLSDGPYTIRVEARIGNLSSFAEVRIVVSIGTEQAYILDPALSQTISMVNTFGLTRDKQENIYVSGKTSSGALLLVKYSANGMLVWSQTLSSTDNNITPGGIAADSEGNVYVALTSAGGVDGNVGQGGRDGYLVKYDAAGILKWTKQIATDQADGVHGVAIDTSGDIYVSGTTVGDLFGWQIFDGYQHAFWIKYDANGNQIDKRILTTRSSVTRRTLIALDRGGNVYLAGTSDGDVEDKWNLGYEDYFLAKFEPTGNSWVIQGGTEEIDRVWGLSVDALGGVYIVGGTYGSLAAWNAGYDTADIFMMKYDSNGVYQWSKQWGGTYFDQGSDVIAEPNGNIYLTGLMQGSLPGASGTGGLFVIKLDSSGNERWAKQMGSFSEIGRAVILDASNNLYVSSDHASTSFLYKLTDPRLPMLTLDQGSKIWTKTESVLLSGSVETGMSVTVIADAPAIAAPVITPLPGRWSSSVSGLVKGSNGVAIATGENMAGFRNHIERAIILDTDPPILTILSPVSGLTYTTKPDLIYTVSEGDTKVFVNGIQIFTQSGSRLLCLFPGTNTVRVEAIDNSGNITYAEITFEAEGLAIGLRSYDPEWIRQIGMLQGPLYKDEYVSDLALDKTGNSYTIGYAGGNIVTNVTTESPGVVVLQYDSQGNKTTMPAPAWQFGIDSKGNAIAVDEGGNVHTAWTTRTNTSHGPKTTFTFTINVTKNSGYMGTEIWSNTDLESTNTNYSLEDTATDLTVDDTSGIIHVVGNVYGSVASQTYGGGGGTDYFISKINGNGNTDWTIQSGLYGNDSVNSVAVDPTGNIYLAGQTSVNPENTSQSVPNCPVVIKYNSSGDFVWGKLIYSEYGGNANGVALDTKGNIYITGNVNIANGRGDEVFLAKYDQNGNPLWAQPIIVGSTMTDIANGIAIDADDFIWVTGYTEGNFDGNVKLGFYGDLIVAVFDSAGEKLWSRQLGSEYNDVGRSIKIDSQNNPIILGATSGYMDGVGTGNDLFIMKLSPFLPVVSINTVTTPVYSTTQDITGTKQADAIVMVTVSTGASTGEITYPDGISGTTWACTVSNLIHGDNIIYVREADSSGRFSTTATTIKFIDTGTPQVTIISPTLGFAGNSQPQLIYTVTDESPVIVVVKVDNGIVEKKSGENLELLAYGSHSVWIEATDTAGNSAFAVIEFFVDTLPPNVVIAAPSGLSNNNQPTLTYTVTDASPVTVVVKLDNVIVQKTSGENVGPLAEGPHKVWVSATDAVGNFAAKEVNFSIDATPPVLVITSPVGAINNNQPYLEYTVDDANAVVAVKVDGAIVQKTSGQNLSPLDDGSHTIWIGATDAAGNPAFGQANFSIDTVTPTGDITINSDATYTTNAVAILTLSASDLNGVTSMRFSADGSDWSSLEEAYVSSRQWTLASEGTNTVYVKYKDSVGNWSVPYSDSIILDTDPPVGSIVINNNDVYSTSLVTALTLSATDGNSVLAMKLSSNGVDWSYPEPLVTSMTWTFASEETNTVYVTYMDNAGNWSEVYSDTITFDRTAPVCLDGGIVINSGASYATDPTVTLTLSGTDSSGIAKMQLTNDETAWPIHEEDYQTTKTWQLASGEGVKSVSVRFKDAAGIWSPACTDTIVLDTTPPVGTIIINNGALYANSASVSLVLAAYDANGVAAMGLSNDSGSTWSTLPLVSQMTWILSSDDGQKNVYVKYQDNAGLWSAGTAASITLDTTPPAGIIYTKIAAGRDHVLGLKSDGTLWAWGGNAGGQLGDGTMISRTFPVQVGTASDWISIAAGNYTSYAIDSNGSLWAWGDNAFGQLGNNKITDSLIPVNVINANPDTTWVAVAGGANFALAIKSDGSLWAWGDNAYGQLGNNFPTDSLIPQLVPNHTDWAMISAGANHVAGLKSDGSVWTWGYNVYGQIGNGSNVTAPEPVEISIPTENQAAIVSIATGGHHTLAKDANGTLWAWGYNLYGELGINSLISKTTPIQVGNPGEWIDMAGGWFHSFGKKADGKLYAWGYNFRGELGDGTSGKKVQPVKIGDDTDWIALSGGLYHSAGLKSDGTVWVWGNDDIYGGINRSKPTLIGSQSWNAIAGGTNHTVAIQTNGTLWTWGYNVHGELGTLFPIDQSLPVQVGSAYNWTSVSAGMYHTAAANADGELWAWGYNNYGQLGDGTVTKRTAPKKIITNDPVEDAIPWTAVSLGANHSVALKQDGSLWTWGDNAYGQLCSGPTNTADSHAPVHIGTATNWVAVAAGANHTLALNQLGELWACGYNHYGQLGDATKVNKLDMVKSIFPVTPFSGSWMSVAAGSNHTLALDTNGRLYAWGLNSYGQLGNGYITLKTQPVLIGDAAWGWDRISCGNNHSLARRSDGTLWAWGSYGYGQLGEDGRTTDSLQPTQVGNDADWVLVEAGGFHTAALKSNNTLWTWGYNGYGQLGEGSAPDKKIPVPVDTEGSVIINDRMPLTNSAEVSLVLKGTDLSGISEVQFSNDNLSWSNYETFAQTKIWMLEYESGYGKKAVYVRFKDMVGNESAVFKDTILLENP